LYLVGVDKTQSIALDELFGKKIVNAEGTELTVRTFRKTRVTTASKVDERDLSIVSLNTKTAVENTAQELEEGEIQIPVKVTRG
jgi:hypothetical protein